MVVCRWLWSKRVDLHVNPHDKRGGWLTLRLRRPTDFQVFRWVANAADARERVEHLRGCDSDHHG